jgi:hypothetical protein
MRNLSNAFNRVISLCRKNLFMVFNATFNNIADIVAEETGLPGENHLPPQKNWKK